LSNHPKLCSKINDKYYKMFIDMIYNMEDSYNSYINICNNSKIINNNNRHTINLERYRKLKIYILKIFHIQISSS
jgi:hypothetical protein